MIARRLALASALAVGAVALAACGSMTSSSSSSSPSAKTMTVPLSAAQQVPPTPSSGSGSARVTIDGNLLSWSVSYSGLTGPVTAAHFHGPAVVGANAGVVLPFTGSLASTFSGSAQLTTDQATQLRAGMWYINLHTAAHPGGEIRGQVR